MTTNYGTTLSDSGGSIGELVSIDPPEYMQATIETTNHSSGGVRKFESGGLREMAEFKATVNAVPANVAAMVTKMVAGTKSAYTILFPNLMTERFSAIPTAIKPMTADATKPETLKVEITFRPSDSLDFSS
jgi:hypothetical protein